MNNRNFPTWTTRLCATPGGAFRITNGNRQKHPANRKWKGARQSPEDLLRRQTLRCIPHRTNASRCEIFAAIQSSWRFTRPSFLGFPVFRYIDIDDAEEVIRAINMTDENLPIDLVLHTPGGLVLASLQIAHAIKAHKAKVTVFVPHYAMSGGTLIALAADEIIMQSHAVLGPVDPQLGEYPAASFVKVIKTKDINEVDDKTLILADVAEKALQQIRSEVCCDINGAPVSTPLDWQSLTPSLDPSRFNLKTIFSQLAKRKRDLMAELIRW